MGFKERGQLSYLSVKRSWKWFIRWWSFQRRSTQFTAALPTTTNLSIIPGFGPPLTPPPTLPNPPKNPVRAEAGRIIRPSGATGGSEGLTGSSVSVCECLAVPGDRWGKGEKEKNKNRGRWEGTREALGEGFTSKRSETVRDSGSSHGRWRRRRRKWARGQKDGGGGGVRHAGREKHVGRVVRGGAGGGRSWEGLVTDTTVQAHSAQHRKSFILRSAACHLPPSSAGSSRPPEPQHATHQRAQTTTRDTIYSSV